jgi:lipopolysaccharide export system permease protein
VPEHLTELHLKIAFPLAPLVVTLLVCSFALHPRAGKAFVQFGSGVALVLAYYIVTVFLRKLGHRMVIPPFLAAWTPNLIFLILGGQWFVRHTGIR